MLTVQLTEQQLELLETLVGEKFNEVAQAWLPAEETKDMNALCYDTLLNLRTVRAAAEFDETYANWDKEFWNFDKVSYLKEVHYIKDEQIAQQGIGA
jgi:hypothetical protein